MDKTLRQYMWLIIAVVVLLVIIAIAWYFYRQGKKKVTIAEVPSDHPATGNGGVSTAANQISDNDVVLLADELHSDIHAIFGFRNADLYTRLIALSDTDLVRIYNAYNKKFQADDGETLLQALNGEWLSWWSSTAEDMKTIAQRLSKYNLI